MMGHREKLCGAIEYDLLTRAHHLIHKKPGERKLAKRVFSRRQRRQVRQELKRDAGWPPPVIIT